MLWLTGMFLGGVAGISFLAGGRFFLGIIALVAAEGCLWSWRKSEALALKLARQSYAVQAMMRGEVEEGSAAYVALLSGADVEPQARDYRDVPDWIATLSMACNAVAFVMFVVALYGWVF